MDHKSYQVLVLISIRSPGLLPFFVGLSSPHPLSCGPGILFDHCLGGVA